MKSYTPSPTLAQWDNFHRALLRHTNPPKLHCPQLWEDLKQCMYEAKLLLRTHRKAMHLLACHKRFRAIMRARRGMMG